MEHEKRKITTDALTLGMYVAELDRPWLDSPFLFQGFEIKTEAELSQLRSCCEYVYVDVTRSRDRVAASQKPVQPKAARPQGDAAEEPDFRILDREQPRMKSVKSYRVELHQVSRESPLAESRFRLDAPDTGSPVVDRRFVFRKVPGSAPAAPPPPAKSARDYLKDMGQAVKVFRTAHSYVRGLLEDARLGQSIDVAGARDTVGNLVDSVVQDESALIWLTQLKNQDEYTSQHSLNVCVIALVFGRHLGLNEDALHELGIGALLHDVGKMKIPLEILNKPDRPTDAERRILERHPAYGYEILAEQSGVPLSALEIVYSHHERVDGTGYPRRLGADDISPLTLIVSIADVYDAVTSDRVYHMGISPHEALNMMYESENSSFDPDLLDEFIQCLGIYPVGSIVELNSGEVGVVLTINRRQRLKPMVSLLLAPGKDPYPVKKLVNLELLAARGSKLAIKKILAAGAHGIDVRTVLAPGERFEALQ